MDNCATHRSQELKELCAENKIELLFLPPYSPDFNSIEKSFHALKQWMQQHQNLASSYIASDDFEDFLWQAVELFMAGKDAKGYFRSAHIEID